MKILVLGSGGREHALVHTFHRQGHKVYCLPGNGGTEELCEPLRSEWKGIRLDEHDRLLAFAVTHAIDLTVVGPEAPLEKGISNLFVDKGLNIFGPTKKGARLESSKAWSKNFMHKHKIPTARFVNCTSTNEALSTVHRVMNDWSGVVIKPDGLTAGKGVTLCSTLEEANEAIDLIMEVGKYGPSGKHTVIEEMLTGPEVSILAFCDGNTIVPMIASQDHKRLKDRDQGPNTGGVGAYAPLPTLSDSEMKQINQEIIQTTLKGLQKEKISYRGILYFGIMLTENGPKVLEFNCRFGDPEAQVVLPLLKSDLAEVMLACTNASLNTLPPLQWSSNSCCCVVMYSNGYPGEYQTGHTIEGIDQANRCPGTIVFHAGTKIDEKGKLVSSGGRVLGVTAMNETLEKSIQQAYEAVEKIHFEGASYRKDIAHHALACI